MMINDDLVFRIAEKLRSIRKKKNLTIQQLADRTGVTKGLLSKIENSQTIPSLPVFVQLTRSLDISLKDFFADMVLINGKNYLHVKRNEYTEVEREGRSGIHYHHILARSLNTCMMEAMLLTLEPGKTGIPGTADGYEFSYMISGQCNYHIDQETIHLEEGDSLFLDASVPHFPANSSEKNVVKLTVNFITP